MKKEERELEGRKSEETKKETDRKEMVEGYSYCDSQKSRCMNDCGGGAAAGPFISSLS